MYSHILIHIKYIFSNKIETIQYSRALLKHFFLFINTWVYIQNEMSRKYIPNMPTKVPNSIQVQAGVDWPSGNSGKCQRGLAILFNVGRSDFFKYIN